MMLKRIALGFALLTLIANTSCSLLIPNNSKYINPTEGGKIILPDGSSIIIPPNSLADASTISISIVNPRDSKPMSSEYFPVGEIYEVNIGSSNIKNTITIELAFDTSKLPQDIEPSEVFLTYYDETLQEWVYAGGEVDTNRNVVILQTNHASLWRTSTWNWKAWIAVLNSVLQGQVISFFEAARLLTKECPQAGTNVSVDSSQSLNMIQGCIERDDIENPTLRIINIKSFYYEIRPISGGRNYPSPEILSPGEDLEFDISISDPSPLVIRADITQKAGVYLVITMVLNLLPVANGFNFDNNSVQCIAEQLHDVSYFIIAAKSLLVDKDGLAAAERLNDFMKDKDAVKRFITAARDCKFKPAKQWSFAGIKQIAGAFNTILNATDYIANYLAGNSGARISFLWTPPLPTSTCTPTPTQTPTPTRTLHPTPTQTQAQTIIPESISVTVPANIIWVDTGAYVEMGQILTFSATGNVSTVLNGSSSGPDGQSTICPDGDNKPDCLFNGEPYGKLVGKIGSGNPFPVGSSSTITASSSGILYLAVNDNIPYFEDNSGVYQVMITKR